MNKHGRLHYSYPRSGRLFRNTRAAKFSGCSAVSLARDLKNMISGLQADGKKAIFLIVNGEPDFSLKHQSVLFALGRMWKDTGLDVLSAVSYAPGPSAGNMIEHAWAPRSKDLAGVTSPAALPGEAPPCEQSGLGEDDKMRKEAVVFDLALCQLCSYWVQWVQGFC